MTILHMVRRPDQAIPCEIIAEHAGDPANRVRVVYLQDGVYRSQTDGIEELALESDRAARGVSDEREGISYERLVEMIFESDRVVSW